jgi:hypothetical protein
VVVVSDVRVGLADVITDSIEVIVLPVFVGKEASGVFLDECGEAVAGLVMLVGDVELFGELYR